MSDGECICEGNWRLIVKECEPFIGERYEDADGNLYTFFGVVHGRDDYYYGMFGSGTLRLLSCVGSIEGSGFYIIPSLRHLEQEAE